MDWKKILASLSGTVDEDLQLRVEYLKTENRLLRKKLGRRVPWTDPERKRLSKVAAKLSKSALADVAGAVKPETLLAWHRRLVERKEREVREDRRGRPPIAAELEALILRLAEENRSWGYDRIAGALRNLGYKVSDQTVGNVLKRNGFPPAPERARSTTWAEFVARHRDVLVATDFFTAGVWTPFGLALYSILFFIRLRTREVHIAGLTTSPDGLWMDQVARNVTMTDTGFLRPGDYLIHDRDTKYTRSFQDILKDSGVECVPLPPRSPDLNAYAERWVRSVREECLSKLILIGEGSLRRVLAEYLAHYHAERNHQGVGNVLLFPGPEAVRAEGELKCRQRLGGMLRFYYRDTG